MQDKSIISVVSRQSAPGPACPDRGLSSFNKVESGLSGLSVSAAMTARQVAGSELRARLIASRRAREIGQPARLRRLAGAHGRTAPGRRYSATVASGDTVLVIDSAKARVQRAQRRIRAWAGIIPSELDEKRRGKSVLQAPRLVMLTLTYASASDWERNDIREYMQRVRKELKGRLIAYAWVLEMQSRGAPHYHVLLYVRRGTRVSTPDSSGQWTKGMSKVETARSPFYIATYIGKEHQKEMLPAGARMFAVWISDKVVGLDALLNLRMASLPAWFRNVVQDFREAGGRLALGDWARAQGGGWILRPTGEIFPSPWTLQYIEVVRGRLIDW